MLTGHSARNHPWTFAVCRRILQLFFDLQNYLCRSLGYPTARISFHAQAAFPELIFIRARSWFLNLFSRLCPVRNLGPYLDQSLPCLVHTLVPTLGHTPHLLLFHYNPVPPTLGSTSHLRPAHNNPIPPTRHTHHLHLVHNNPVPPTLGHTNNRNRNRSRSRNRNRNRTLSLSCRNLHHPR